MSWVAVGVGVVGMGASWYGNSQRERASRHAQAKLSQSGSIHTDRQGGLNADLTGDIDAIAAQRRNALSRGLGHMASGDRYAAGADASNRAVTQGALAARSVNSRLPIYSNYTTRGSGATQRTLGFQQSTNNKRLGDALSYTGAVRGNAALEDYDQSVFNRLGTDYTSLGRQTGEAQQVGALRQAEMERIWQQIAAERGMGVENAQSAGNNAQMLGQALMLTGSYGSSIQANRPAAQNTGASQQAYGNSSNYATGDVAGDPYFR